MVGIVEGLTIWIGIPTSYTGQILIYTLGLIFGCVILEVLYDTFKSLTRIIK